MWSRSPFDECGEGFDDEEKECGPHLTIRTPPITYHIVKDQNTMDNPLVVSITCSPRRTNKEVKASTKFSNHKETRKIKFQAFEFLFGWLLMAWSPYIRGHYWPPSKAIPTSVSSTTDKGKIFVWVDMWNLQFMFISIVSLITFNQNVVYANFYASTVFNWGEHHSSISGDGEELIFYLIEIQVLFFSL